jgi:multiple sugar transport system permease protein
MITPGILFNLVLGVIGSFQSFTAAFIVTNGGPGTSTLLYALYLYKVAFQNLQMGYASALAWVLFLVILVVTLVQLAMARLWVYYEGATPTAGAPR